MSTPCNLVEDLFRVDHLDWSKLECIEFKSNWWDHLALGIGWDITLKAKHAKGFKPNA